MARVLTVSRVQVAPEHTSEYLATFHSLAALCRVRNQHLWLYRSASDPHRFIEFSESPTRASHRSRASRTDYELKLEQRLKELARYADDSWDLWDEVTSPTPADSEEESTDERGI
jgi:hypothetical protein